MWFLLQVVGQVHKKMWGTRKAKLKDDLARACSTSGSRKNSSPLPSTFSHYTTDSWRDFWVAAMVWNMVLDDLVRVGVQKALLTIKRGLPGSKDTGTWRRSRDCGWPFYQLLSHEPSPGQGDLREPTHLMGFRALSSGRERQAFC